MNFSVEFGTFEGTRADWLVLGKWESEAGANFDRRLSGLVERGDITGKAREVTPVLDGGSQRILVVGLGQRDKADAASLVGAASAAGRAISTRQFDRVALAMPDKVPNLTDESVARLLLVGFRQGCEGPGLRKSKPDRHVPKEIVLIAPADSSRKAMEDEVRRAGVESSAVSLARELVNLPPCDLYPETFAIRAQEIASRVRLSCEVWDEKRLAEERMNVLLAVARGSDRPPRFVILRHNRGGNAPTLALVGKGVTFDSGGLSLKTTEQMVDMKCDMAGAAAVLGAMQAIAELDLPVNVMGVLAMVENLPGSKAMKLGDVLQARNSKTIEVLNTDAEGRLILADALSYVVEQGPGHIVDLATLTGACLVALGSDVAGLMSNHDDWSERVRSAAKNTGEMVWPLPMYPHYGDMIKSEVADMKNTGGSRYAGAISAAKFLEQFVGDIPWVHLDIAGPAWAEKENASRAAGGTGAFVRTLVELARTYR